MPSLPESSIATATTSDLPDVVALLAAQFGEHHIDAGDIVRAALGLIQNPSRGTGFLASIDDARVGVAVLAFTWTLDHGGLVAWLPAHAGRSAYASAESLRARLGRDGPGASWSASRSSCGRRSGRGG